jgi:hypothetical protein
MVQQTYRPGSERKDNVSRVTAATYILTKGAQALTGVAGERKHLRTLRRGEATSVTVVVSRIL